MSGKNISSLIVVALVGYGIVHAMTATKAPEKVVTKEDWKSSADYDFTMFNQDMLSSHPDKSRECSLLQSAITEYRHAEDEKAAKMALEFKADLCR